MTTKYIVLRIHPWSSIEAKIGSESAVVRIPGMGKSFCPVYDDREKAAEDYPNDEILPLDEQPADPSHPLP